MPARDGPANHTGISSVFDRLVTQFDIMFENHAYTHWYEKQRSQPRGNADFPQCRGRTFRLLQRFSLARRAAGPCTDRTAWPDPMP